MGMKNRLSPDFQYGGPQRGTIRTFQELVKKLVQYFSTLDTSKSDDLFSQYLISKNPPNKSRLNSTHSLVRSRSN